MKQILKKAAACLLALAMLAGLGAIALGEEGGMRIVSCPEQNFSTLCRPEYGIDFHPDDGLTISLGDAGIPAHVIIFKTDAPGADYDAEYYYEHAFIDSLVANYGSDLVSISDVQEYTFNGVTVVGRMVIYEENGEGRMLFSVVDRREECFVMYRVYAIQEEEAMKAGLTAMAVAMGNFQPDADYYYNYTGDPEPEPEPAAMAAVSCPDGGFATLADPAHLIEIDGNAATIYVEGEERIPYVIVMQGSTLLGEPFEYIKEQITPYMRGEYGDSLLNVEEIEAFDVGGKQLPCGRYTYLVQGHTVISLRILDSTGAHTVSYTAKYLEGEGDATLAALDAAVANFQPDPNYYN